MFSSVFGSASGTGLLIAEVVRVNRGQTLAQAGPPSETPEWRMAALWCLVTPLIWSFLPIPFVTLTVLVNALNVVVLPFLTAVVWLLTSRADLIGADWTNVWYEHAVMGGLFILAIWGAYNSIMSLASHGG